MARPRIQEVLKMTRVSVTMTEDQHRALHGHLFPGDGLEAVALLLCGRHAGRRHRLFVREVVRIAHDQCRRTVDRVSWSTELLPELLERADKKGMSIVKIHGHSAYRQFSEIDDVADGALFPSLYGWLGSEHPLGSMIMMADGGLMGRVCEPNGSFTPFESTAVVGNDIKISFASKIPDEVPEFGERIAQSFGKGTFELFRHMKIGVVGCSGTGSPVVEMLARNCTGALVLVDPDTVEERNLNRILNTSSEDARLRRPKVQALKRAIDSMGLGTQVEVFAKTTFERSVVEALADCDVLFGCMDSVDGRHLLNRLAAFYMIPYFDLGVKLEADGTGGIDQICGSVHYLKPGGSSLLSRHVYSSEQLRAAGLKRTDPTTYRDLLEEGYIKGVAEDRPAVIQLNMLIASFAVNELLARVHPYRLDQNSDFAIRRISLSHGIFETEPDGEACPSLTKHVGRGDVEPLLEWPELSREAA
jgi:hypothetical protein